MSSNEPTDLDKIPGIGPKRAKALRVAGYETLDDLEDATEADLREVAMFDEILARDIKATVSPSTEDPVRVKQPHNITPDDWQLTAQQVDYLRTQAEDIPADLTGVTASAVRDQLEYAVDSDLLGFRQVCGRVVTYDADTDEYHPVPNATVHIEDTDCSFLSYFPPDLTYGWLFPYQCNTRETIATTTTNKCGEFRVHVPMWDIDRVVSFREKRICLPDIVRPRLRDVLQRPEVFPEPVIPPGPRPDPRPNRIFDVGTFDRTRGLLGEQTVMQLDTGTEAQSFGELRSESDIQLDRPAFPNPPEPPLPPGFRGPEPDARVEHLNEDLPVDPEVLRAVDPDRVIGPFLRCRDVVMPEWRTIIDVPDITFRVTQDTDGDGDKETIYSEGYFDVRWNESGSLDVDLIADDEAHSIPNCEGLTPENLECENPSIESIGLMPTQSPMYDQTTGYATQINRPRPTSGGQPDGTAPFAKTLQLHGCHRFEEATYYRVMYSHEGGAEQPFTGHEWHVPAIGRDPYHVTPVSEGWYHIADIPTLEEYYGESLNDNPLVFPFWFFNWNTRGYQNGTYEVSIQLGDSDMEPLEITSPTYTITVDNRQPHLNISTLVWGPLNENDELTAEHDITEECPRIERTPGDDIGIKVTFRAWGEHFRSVRASAHGCENTPTVIAPATSSQNEYTYWHESVGTRSHTQTVVFKVPASYPQGAYRIHLRGTSRAFNPAGSNQGPGTNWEYDTALINAHFNQGISITNK